MESQPTIRERLEVSPAIGTVAVAGESQKPEQATPEQPPATPPQQLPASAKKPILPWDNSGMQPAHGDSRAYRNWL